MHVGDKNLCCSGERLLVGYCKADTVNGSAVYFLPLDLLVYFVFPTTSSW